MAARSRKQSSAYFGPAKDTIPEFASLDNVVPHDDGLSFKEVSRKARTTVK